MLASNREQEQLIDALLTLASSETGLDHRVPVDLAALTDELLGRPNPDIARLGLHVHATTRSATLDGDPRLIQRLAANLINNAARHNIADGHMDITTATTQSGAVLSVTNTGPVIPPTGINRLFLPFERLQPRRTHRPNGHGLGLPIVHAIASAHGATITTQASPDGGLAIHVSFPTPPRRPLPTDAGQHAYDRMVADRTTSR